MLIDTVRPGAVIAQKYRLDSLLAEGGMGEVWKGHHILLGTPIAVKFIGSEAARSDEARIRFEVEARAAAVIRSPHVVRIHDYGVDGEIPYLVMELLDGEDLGARLTRSGKLSPEETSSLVSQAARALHRAAEAGIVHRDLKPSNVFLARDEEDEVVKILDFGVARAPRISMSDVTKVGTVVGSPRYMSPEQACGQHVDHRSDLWSLAVIAYRALVGQTPFPGEDVLEVLANICLQPAPPPSQFDATLGPAIDAFFARALERDPERRFQSAREMAAAFAEATGQEPLSSWRGGSPRAAARSAPRLNREGSDPEATLSPAEAVRSSQCEVTLRIAESAGSGARPPGGARAHRRATGAVVAALALGMVVWGASSRSSDGVAIATAPAVVATTVVAEIPPPPVATRAQVETTASDAGSPRPTQGRARGARPPAPPAQTRPKPFPRLDDLKSPY